MSESRFSIEARAVRESHDAVALRAFIDARYKPADDIEPSKVGNPDNYIRDFPSDLDARISAMETRLFHEEAGFRDDVARYEQIRLEGLAALDSLEIMYFGSGDPKMAINSPMLILEAHIASYKVMIPRYRELLQQWAKERSEAGVQLSML
jgi:hypothetical protein